MTCAVEACSITKVVGDGAARVDILHGIDVGVQPGEFVAITGPSGSGKSTLLHLMAGLDEPTSGSILICGENLSFLDDDQRTLLRRRRIGLIFQSFHLLDILTAEENISLPMSLAGMREREIRQRTDWALTVVSLAHRRTHRPGQLSGGEQQRVAIARSLVGAPSILLADEPTGNLDSESGKRIMQLLRTLVDRIGLSLLMVTHDPACAAVADREIHLRDGRVISTDRRVNYFARSAA